MFSTALKKEMTIMVDAFEALAMYASSWMKSPVKIPVNWPTSANQRFKNNCKVFDDIIYSVIERRKNEMISNAGSSHGDLLDIIMMKT